MPSNASFTQLYSFPTRRSSDLGEAVDAVSAVDQVDAVARAQVDWVVAQAVGRVAVYQHFAGDDPHVAFARCGEQRRSEEHTSELQSPCNIVCRLLLGKTMPVTN